MSASSPTPSSRAGVEPWDTEWAAEKAADALRYLGRNAPEVLENPRVLDEPERVAHEAAMRGDRDAYLEALRSYMRAGRDEALRIRPKGGHFVYSLTTRGDITTADESEIS